MKKSLLFLLICCLFAQNANAVNTKNMLKFGIITLTIGMTVYNMKTRIEGNKDLHTASEDCKDAFTAYSAYETLSKCLKESVQVISDQKDEDFRTSVGDFFSSKESNFFLNIKEYQKYFDKIRSELKNEDDKNQFDLYFKNKLNLSNLKTRSCLTRQDFIIFLQKLDCIVMNNMVNHNRDVNFFSRKNIDLDKKISILNTLCGFGIGIILGGFFAKNLE